MGKVASRKKWTKRDVERLRGAIQRKLDSREGKLGFALKVGKETLQEGEWLFFVVVPVGPGVRAYEYAHTLTQVVEGMYKQGMDRHVLLVPALPD